MKDPVCGMDVEASSPFHAERDGKTFYFCRARCRDKFLGKAEPAQKAVEPGSVYTCPMHPEIESATPGDCPICGMALEATGAATEDTSELDGMLRRLWISAALTIPVFILAMMHTGGSPQWHHISRWIQFALSTPVVLWGAWPFFVRGWKSILSRHLNMFTLISIGVTTAFLLSAAAMLIPGIFPANMSQAGKVPVYFEGAAVIVVLVLLGQVLELRARSRTGAAIKALMNLSPKTARLVTSSGDNEVPLANVKVNDLLRVVPGTGVPVDGVVVEGRSSVEESMITGEPMPVEKGSGDKVTAGTINGSGSFVMKAERVGKDTLLARIVDMVAQAQRSKAPIQGLADKVAAVFVPLVVLAACITFAMWLAFGPEPRLAYAFINAIAVLIIACPCALGLATPMSIMVGIGKGAQSGILIRNAEAIQALEGVTTIVMDKTGTLTEGKPRLIEVVTSVGFEEGELLHIAAAVEQGSEHPLGLAIVRGAKDRNETPHPAADDFASVAGGGVSGQVNGHRVLVGKPSFIVENGVRDIATLEKDAYARRAKGQTVVFIAVDGRAAGFFAIADTAKADAAQAVRELHGLGLNLIMLTGDNRLAANAIAGQLGLDQVVAEMDPAGKVDYVKKLRAEGKAVAMVGDGVNDAPALSEADLGIAMGNGTDVAMESAGITIVKGDLLAVARAVRLSRATMKNIRQNLFFAFVYNACGIPIAAGLFYPFFGLLLNPMIAAVAMSFSSVSVIANALRLRNARL